MTNRMADENEDYVFELGDHIAINTSRYGIVKGFIYYRDMDLIRIMPDGVSDRLYDFPLEDGEFSKELGFKTASWISKNPLPTFVEQQDLQAGQYFETFTANGEPAGSYKIESVNIDDDTIIAEDESGAQTEITFGYIGIPLDLPFAVLRIREPPAESKANDDVTSYGINLNSDEAQAEKEAELGITVSSDFVRELEETTAQVAAIDDALEAGRAVDDDDFEDVEIQDYVRLPVFEQTFEKPSAFRSYPEELQKSDALQDFTSFLSVKQQQDIRQLRKIRQLTEMCAQLKNEVILYKASDHTFESLIPQSYTYINELLSSGVTMPLRRPVLDVNLRVFEIVNDKLKWPLTNSTIINETVRGIVNQPKADEVSWEHVNDIVNEALGALPELPDNGDQSHLDIQNFTTFLTDLTDAKLGTKYIGINRPSFYEQEVRTQNLIGRPWKRSRELPDHMWAAREDSEFLRSAIPDLTTPAAIEGLESGETLRGNFDPATVAIGRVKLSMKRALGPIYRKGRIPLLNAEDAPIKADVIFPLEYKYDLGSHRSGLLLYDSLASQVTKRTIFEVLQEAGPINDTAKTNSILTVGIDGNTDGNIKVSDFIGKFPLHGLGPTYVLQPLANYGLANKEINMETAEVVMNKVKDNINSVKAYIKKLREELAAASPEPTNANIFIEDIKQWLLGTVIEAEPLLAEIMRRFKTMTPGAASESDIAIISYIYTKEPDLFLAAAGGNPDQVAYERMMAGLRFNVATVKEGLALKTKIENAGEEPQPNPCEHVAALNSITLIEDPEERMYYKGQFVNRYQGQRIDNWIKCSVCARDLVCVHELLELEMFNRPQERDVLRKEMYLHFCGPVMGNYYSCRNCGQSLGNIEFDNNIQFDDQGRPMMGRAVIVDQDAIKMEQINQTIMAATEEVKTIDFGDTKKNQIYFTIKEVTDRLSIYPTMTDYEQMISMILTELGSFISRDDFVTKFSAENPGKKIPDYDVLLNRHTVINTCCAVLIHIQSRIPDYQPIAVLAGCKNPGFGGYPIGAADNLTGIEYVACAAASIMKNDIPWNMTGFQKESDGKRQKAIATMMQRQIQKLMEKANIQQILLDKRRYLKDIYGAAAEGIEGKVNDEISKFFLPAQRIITAKDAAEAETVIIPEVNSHTTQVGRAAIWIQKANRVAKDTGLERGEILIGSPFTEGAACYSAIKKPQGFWDEGHGLPKLQERRLDRGAAGTQLTVPFAPKPLVNIIATAPANIYYKLFLAVCWQGDRKGLPHEFGFNHRCPHCELTIVPYEKSITDIEFDPKSYKKYMGEVARFKDDYEAYMSSQFETQGIQINEETFQDLLTATHRRYSVKPFERPKHMNVFDVLRSVALLDPAPINEWPAVIEHTIAELSKLTADSNIGDIQEALDQLSQLGPNALKEIAIDRYPRNENLIQILQGLVSMQPSEIGEALTSHFILPMQRLINFVDPAAFVRLSPDLISPNEQQKISKEHLEDIQNFIMYNNNVLSTYHGDFAPGKNELAKAKMDFCVKQLAQIPPLLQKLNINTLIGGERTFKYLIQALVFCPLRTLLDPNTLPSAQYRQDARAAYGDTSFSVIGRVLASCILKYKDDRMLYSDEQIQAALQDRIEKEEIKVIRDYDVLDDEDKYLKIMRKNIGIEEYAVGGTKAIQQYDAERYEIERKERADAGHVDFNFALVDPNVFYPLGGRVHDPNSEDTIFGNDDVGEGYDHNDYDDDDY